ETCAPRWPVKRPDQVELPGKALCRVGFREPLLHRDRLRKALINIAQQQQIMIIERQRALAINRHCNRLCWGKNHFTSRSKRTAICSGGRKSGRCRGWKEFGETR